jgi:hypothetical protein
MCDVLGARLCTADELMNDEAKLTGVFMVIKNCTKDLFDL